jgi:hypothetical protein
MCHGREPGERYHDLPVVGIDGARELSVSTNENCESGDYLLVAEDNNTLSNFNIFIFRRGPP